jgi:hypothetical protein
MMPDHWIPLTPEAPMPELEPDPQFRDAPVLGDSFVVSPDTAMKVYQGVGPYEGCVATEFFAADAEDGLCWRINAVIWMGEHLDADYINEHAARATTKREAWRQFEEGMAEAL